jgi:drug/metabolite transporter (DMT)-like permease
MSSVIAGACAACGASSLYNVGVALQALEARAIPHVEGLRPSLLRSLARRRRWLLGTALNVLGWPLQTVALLLAPLAVVQPGLAFGLLLLLALGARALGERVGLRELAAVAGIVLGVAWLAAVAPDTSTRHAGAAVLAAVLGALGVVALAPYLAGRGSRIGGIAAALSAGAALAWSGLSTKFVADAVSTHVWGAAVAWAIATGLASGLGLLSEMTALQRRAATQVAPLVFVVQVIVPVTAAPLLTGENWAHAPLGPGGIVAGLTLVTAAAVVLTSSPIVRAVVDEPSESAATDVTSSPRDASRDASAAMSVATREGRASAVTTTMSPADSEGSARRSAPDSHT